MGEGVDVDLDVGYCFLSSRIETPVDFQIN